MISPSTSESSGEMTEPKGSENATAPAGASRYRWFVLGLAFLVTLINYLDRSAMSYAIGPISREFHLTDKEFGYIQAAFGVGYIVMTFVGGLLVDHIGARKIWSLAAFFWSLMTASLGLVSGLYPLCALRICLGLSEGPHFPSLTRVVADWLPAKERARATSLGLMAVPLASAIGAPLISQLIIHLGWRAMFLCLASLGIVWAVCWVLLFRDYPESSKFVNEKELLHIRGQHLDREKTEKEIRETAMAASKTNLRSILLNPALIANNLAFFAFGYLLFFSINWLPGYMEQTFHLPLAQVGRLLIIPWLTAAVLLLCAGWLSDWLWNRTGSMRAARSHLIWVCQLGSALFLIPLMFTHSLPVAIVLISLGIGIGLMPNAAFYALNCDLAKDRAGTSLGIMTCISAGASILAPAITGELAARTGNFQAAFALLVFFTLLSVVTVVCFQKPDKIRAS